MSWGEREREQRKQKREIKKEKEVQLHVNKLEKKEVRHIEALVW